MEKTNSILERMMLQGIRSYEVHGDECHDSEALPELRRMSPEVKYKGRRFEIDDKGSCLIVTMEWE